MDLADSPHPPTPSPPEEVQLEFEKFQDFIESYRAKISLGGAFVEIAEGCLARMESGGRMVAITNPGCNALQTPRVGYDMPGQDLSILALNSMFFYD